MSYGGEELYTLLNVSGVTDLLTRSDYIFFDVITPDETADGVVIPFNASLLLIYMPGPVDGAAHYMQTTWSINCYAETTGQAQALATAVFNILRDEPNNVYFFEPTMISPIPSVDKTGPVNVPIEVDTRGRDFT